MSINSFGNPPGPAADTTSNQKAPPTDSIILNSLINNAHQLNQTQQQEVPPKTSNVEDNPPNSAIVSYVNHEESQQPNRVEEEREDDPNTAKAWSEKRTSSSNQRVEMDNLAKSQKLNDAVKVDKTVETQTRKATETTSYSTKVGEDTEQQVGHELDKFNSDTKTTTRKTDDGKEEVKMTNVESSYITEHKRSKDNQTPEDQSFSETITQGYSDYKTLETQPSQPGAAGKVRQTFRKNITQTNSYDRGQMEVSQIGKVFGLFGPFSVASKVDGETEDFEREMELVNVEQESFMTDVKGDVKVTRQDSKTFERKTLRVTQLA